MAKKAKSSKRAERIDFGDVEKEVGKRGRHIKAGNYKLKIIVHKKGWKDDDKTNPPYFRWKLQIIDHPKYKGLPFYYITSLKKEALFNLRNLIFAASDGKRNVAGKTVDFDPTTLYGKIIGGVIEDEEYKNKLQSRVVDVMSLKELEEDEDEDEDEEDTEDEEDEDEDEEDEEDTEEEDLEEVDEDDI